MQKKINKSHLMNYYFCKENLWLNLNQNFSSKPESEGDKFRASQGDKFELAARSLFPKGVLVEGSDINIKQEQTMRFLENETDIVFQATIESKDFISISDVLVRNEINGSWDLYEIKSTTNIKEDNSLHKSSSNHIKDISFQINVLEMSGIKISSCYIIHPNKEELFSINGRNNKNFFNVVNVTEKVALEKNIVMKDMFEMKEFINGDISQGCNCIYKGRNNHCDTFNISNPDIPDYSIHDLKSVGQSKATLSELASGEIFEISSLPKDHKILTKSRRGQFESYIQKKPIFNITEIKTELSKIKWPIQFLDFESYQSVIPIIDSYYSWEKIPFQWSLHTLTKGGELRSVDFLANSISKDPLIDLSETLLKKINTQGSIVVWHESFEKGILNMISNRMPKFESKIKELLNNIFDLEKIFKANMYCDYRTKGSSSLKRINSILLKDYTYDQLEINNGENAFIEWEKMVSPSISKKEKETIRKNLIEYCKQDTLATYKILMYLNELIKKESK